jgi:hypothetical protein
MTETHENDTLGGLPEDDTLRGEAIQAAVKKPEPEILT